MQPICAHPISDKGIKNSDDVLYAPPRFYVAQKDQALCAKGSACGLESGLEQERRVQATLKLDSKPTYYKPDSPSTYLNTTIGLLGGGIVVSIIGLYIMPESVTNWDRSRFGFKAWLQDVQIGPVIDADNFWLNGVAHPYFGAVYYMQPRVAGYSWAESALFSFITSSIFWEYGIEAFVEIPSWQDLIYTPAMGSIFGEIFYQSTKYIQSNGNRLFGSKILGLIVVGLMDPIGVIMRDFGLAKFMGVRDVRQITSYATPMRVGFAMRF
ncbi:DUF3943 domain-containing protein [Helicobacter canis]|uniref:DUF3943 domain-containing protein n=2 Tax=Helicobacter canis TaxID=29419 RepID=A0A5M9QJ94_9HELI|nr:DUF3943 domain-containing protein [Helicobacter canis]